MSALSVPGFFYLCLRLASLKSWNDSLEFQHVLLTMQKTVDSLKLKKPVCFPTYSYVDGYHFLSLQTIYFWFGYMYVNFVRKNIVRALAVLFI